MKSSHIITHHRIARFALTGILGCVGGILVASPGPVRQVSSRTFAQRFAADPLNGDTLRPAERTFLVNASESTRQQMRLAEVGVSQAESSDIRSHALQMALDFRALNESLEGLIRRKGGIPDAPVGGTSENYHRLIESAGVDFDREFLRIATESNDRALALFEQVASDSRETDIRDFAAAQLPVLRAHRSKLTELKNAAY